MERMDSWDGWKLAWQHGFVAVGLALVLATALPGSGATQAAMAAQIALVVGLGGWYWFWFVRRQTAAMEQRRHLPYLAGAAVLWASAVAVNPALLPLGVAVLIPYGLRSLAMTGVVLATWTGVLVVQRVVAGSAFGWPWIVCLLGALAAAVALGFIATLDREGRARSRLLEELARSQAELAAAERAAGMLGERQRLARDIHDTLTQGFASIAMLLDAARNEMDDAQPASAQVSAALKAARANLATSRDVLWALQPRQDDRLRLVDAARQLTNELAARTRLSAMTVVTGDPRPLPAAVEAAVLRVIQEALTNVAKHANATDVQVTLSYMEDVLAVDVHDDGIGFDTEASSSGYGLGFMRERVGELGGSLTIETVPGDGCIIAAEIPATSNDLIERVRPHA